MNSGKDLNDITQDDWVQKYLPEAWQPYARICRLDRPVGTWLVVLPAIAALFQAAGGFPNIGRLIIFCLGALIVRSAGCTINDIWDRDFDKHVQRTRSRPLTSGQITLHNAVIFLVAQLLLAACLLFFINAYSVLMAILVLPLVIIYPLCKRFTYWPQIVLGAAFNWGMLMAWTDTTDHLPLEAILMWLGAIAWQVGYDSMYAYADMEDDLKLGLKSTAIRFGEQGYAWLAGFYAAAVLLWSLAGHSMGMNYGYWIAMVLVCLHFFWQLNKFNINNRSQSFFLFKANIISGVILLVGAWLGTF
ncbi:4-hydroxybenzoate octaprenyltransferase [Brackiella oedipodis]|uniref:4-hydroxybenzoate octaprenyltransferase n=1 Tax=Brackiella oedipodis TaxID=124225 RepID=UPI000571491E|nr:4-hydroxybenzoate octaprenyltransferase [Brackiella oedipodis]